MAFLALVGLAPAKAAADESPGKAATESAVDQARVHFLRGVKLYEEEDFRAALIEFRRAYDIAPNWAVLYNVARACLQLQDYAAALQAFESYLSEGAGQVPEGRRETVAREIDDLTTRIARLTIRTTVAGAEISVDDVVIGKTPLSSSQRVGAGRHKISASKPGAATATKILDVAGGDELAVLLDLAPLPTSREPRGANTPAYVSFVLAGAGITAGSIFGVMALSDKSVLDSSCPNRVCPASFQRDLDALNRDALLSTVGFGVGLFGLGAATYFLLRGTGEGRDVKAASGYVLPFVGPGSAGLSGRF
jgi:hypothetical protein